MSTSCPPAMPWLYQLDTHLGDNMARQKTPPARPGRTRKTISGWVPVADPDWADRATCAGRDTEVFFPDGDQPDRVAKAYCRRCPVQADCLAHAIENDERYGVWGGVSEHTRELLVVRLRAGYESSGWSGPRIDGPSAA